MLQTILTNITVWVQKYWSVFRIWKILVHFRIRKNIGEKDIGPFLKFGPRLALRNIDKKTTYAPGAFPLLFKLTVESLMFTKIDLS